jgi:hypothetical protein
VLAFPIYSVVLGEVQFDFVDVTPTPILPRLDRPHDGMLGRVKVFRGMFILGRIATTDVPATQAQTKMHPLIAHLQAFFATTGMRFDVLYLIEMRALSHRYPPM